MQPLHAVNDSSMVPPPKQDDLSDSDSDMNWSSPRTLTSFQKLTMKLGLFKTYSKDRMTKTLLGPCQNGSLEKGETPETCLPEGDEEKKEKRKWYQVDEQYMALATIGLCDAIIVDTALTLSFEIVGRSESVLMPAILSLVAGFFSMAASGFLTSIGEHWAYRKKLEKTRLLIESDHEKALTLLKSALKHFGSEEELDHLVREKFTGHLDDAIMWHVYLDDKTKYTKSRPWIAASTLAVAASIGGGLPIISYMSHAKYPAIYSGVFEVVILFLFGCLRQFAMGERASRRILYGGIQTLWMGGLATLLTLACAFGIKMKGGEM